MIQAYKKTVEDALEAYFNELLENKEHKFAKKTIEAMKYTTCLPGKRLRAILCLESCRIFSNEYIKAIPASCALEMLHSQSLIHDDLPSMDNDDLRRGKPSNHKVYGEACAILAGDALISLGAQIIIDKTKNASAQTVLDVTKEYLTAAGIYGIVGGQTADLEVTEENEDYLNYIQKYKTGALFEASCVMGGLLGGANKDKIKLLREFATNFGLAFQMADDILDVISTPEIMGKTTLKDEAENKLTYIKKYGLEGAKEKLNIQINKIYDILDHGSFNSPVFREIVETLTLKNISKRG